MESINVEGYVEKIVFHNEDNGYTVFSVSDSDSGEEITCTGSGIYLNEGQYVKVSGEMTVHKNYGPQLAVREYYEKEPENVAAIEKYLASGAIKGTDVNLRENPSTNSKVIGILNNNELVHILGQQGDWFKVRRIEPDQRGWVFGKYVQ